MKSEFSNKITFLKDIENFKNIERNCKTTNLRHESDAEHSWHLSMFMLTFESEFPHTIDRNKLLRLALIHDLIELKIGDYNPFTDDINKKKEAEVKALKELKIELEKINIEIYELIEEYELQETPESKIVKKIDKLMPLIQNISTSSTYSAYIKSQVTKNQAKKYIDIFFTENDFLKEIYQQLFKEAVEKNIFYTL